MKWNSSKLTAAEKLRWFQRKAALALRKRHLNSDQNTLRVADASRGEKKKIKDSLKDLTPDLLSLMNWLQNKSFGGQHKAFLENVPHVTRRDVPASIPIPTAPKCWVFGGSHSAAGPLVWGQREGRFGEP